MADAAAQTNGAAGTTAAGTTTQPGTTTNTAPPPWHGNVDQDTLGWITNKGFKGPEDVIASARNLEKLMGHPQEKILKIADKMRDETTGILTPEGRAIFERLGVPKDAKEYEIEIPKENADPKLADLLRKVAYEEGIPKSAAEKLAKEWNAYQANAIKAYKDAAEAKAKDAEAVLKKDWGSAYEQNINIAKEAARTLGMDQKTVDALHASLGQDATMKFFHKMGTAVGEGRFIKGTPTQTVLDPNSAIQQINALKQDKGFVEKYLRGDVDSVQRMTRLQEMAYPGSIAVGGTTVTSARN